MKRTTWKRWAGEPAKYPVKTRVVLIDAAVSRGGVRTGTVERYSPAETLQYWVRLDDEARTLRRVYVDSIESAL